VSALISASRASASIFLVRASSKSIFFWRYRGSFIIWSLNNIALLIHQFYRLIDRELTKCGPQVLAGNDFVIRPRMIFSWMPRSSYCNLRHCCPLSTRLKKVIILPTLTNKKFQTFMTWN
jgi:hypothetical protein